MTIFREYVESADGKIRPVSHRNYYERKRFNRSLRLGCIAGASALVVLFSVLPVSAKNFTAAGIGDGLIVLASIAFYFCKKEPSDANYVE